MTAKTHAIYSSRTADKFVVRLPDEMRERIAEIAKTHHRSMNSQMINWMTICVDLEMAGIAVTRDSLAVAANILEVSDKPVIQLSYGEVVQVPEGYLHPTGSKTKAPTRQFETKSNVVEVFALGKVSAIHISTGGDKAMVRVVWEHVEKESDWIPFDDVRKI